MGIANELITRGWVQTFGVDGAGSVCLVGAAVAAHCGDISESDYFGQWDALPARVRRAVCKAVGLDEFPSTAYEQCVEVYTFNDAEDRTFDEVLRVAKEADELLGL